jgi:hypothetical protein
VASRLTLPVEEPALVQALTNILDESERVLREHRAVWYTIYEYLHGNRDFEDISYRDGTVRVRKDDSTTLDFRYEEVVRKCADEVGKLLRMDTMPKVSRRRMSLDHVRRASTAQLVLDSMVSQESADRVKMAMTPLLVQYGTAGVVCWIDPMLPLGAKKEQVGGASPDTSSRPDIEVIPPWELMCVPSRPRASDQVVGVIRTRWVSLAWLKALGFEKELNKDPDKIIVEEKKYGQDPTGSSTTGGVFSVLGGHAETGLMFGGEKNKEDGEVEQFVKLNEMWVEGTNGTLAQYLLWVDEVMLTNAVFAGKPQPPMMPLGVARYIDVGGFYGRGLAEMLLPLNVRNEAALDNIYKNLEELDLFGTVFTPASAGIDPSIYEGSPVPRFLKYEPDYAVPNQVPFKLQPTTIGTFPAEMVKMGEALVDRLAPASLIQEKGRVDSARGLGFLNELSNIPATYVAMSIAGAYAKVYKAMLDKMRRLWPTRTVAIKNFLDDSLAGIIIDPASGTLTADNQIPSPDEVEISITSPFPVSPEQKKRDLYDMLQAKDGLGQPIINARWFRIQSKVLGLDLPVANAAEWENYRKAMLNNIVMFNDGKTPADGAVVGPTDMVDLHLEVMLAFMARPEFQLADQSVRVRFQQAAASLKQMLGGFPAQLPYPEDMTGGPAMGGMPGQQQMQGQQ